MQEERYSPKCSRRVIAAAFGALTQEEEQMPTTATIDSDQRDGIYEVLRNHLGAIGDLWIALEENKDFAAAERLAKEFGEDFRLLDEIGWSPDQERQTFELTMPASELTALLKRVHGEAERVLLGIAIELKPSAADATTEERFWRGFDACEELLADLDQPEGAAA